MSGLTSSIGDLFGGAQNNAGFTASGVPIANPATTGQATGAYNTAQSGLTQQQQLINALSAQNGIANQSNVYNQLQGIANGTGANPAQAALNQNTGQNVANQAALMAGQRGAGSNVGLIARQAAQQGAATQQNAVGQAANLQANQSLNALGQLGGLANQQVAQQTGAVGALNSNAQSEQQNLLNAIAAQNNANVSQQSNINNANAGLAQTNANNTAGAIGGIASGLSGGAVKFAKGGEVENPKLAQVPKSDRYPDHIASMLSIYHPEHLQNFTKVSYYDSGGSIPEAIPNAAKARQASSGPSIPSMGVGSGGSAGAGSGVAGDSGAAADIGAVPLIANNGGKVPGKAAMRGDHKSNDTVPALLTPGEFVIPNSVMESKDPIAGAAKMIAEHLKKGADGSKDQSDFKAALQRAIKGRKNK